MQAAKDIYRVGIPTFVMNAIGSLTTTAMNAILMSFSATAVAVLGIYFKLQSFVFMPIFGLNQGAMPILGYNYGAGDEKRFTRTLVLSFGVAVAIMLKFRVTPQEREMIETKMAQFCSGQCRKCF